ncbi:AraC family transcriptional regulator [Piscinibacter sp.]|uniref:AraC family transcriptional regulator n=1 Tax=Piscinibacter sp. TaxID=1903157 RepID=UPI002C1E5086|nr:AraC family transcriptional regulator [Albitalea sp.]HUG21652.1 AraC family transcriptional regulator [Albitalea sp.]
MERAAPAFEQRIYSPQKIAAVTAELARQGVVPAVALEGAGLDAADLQGADTRVSYRQFDTVFRNALRLSCDPDIGLRAGRRMHVTAHGIYGYALLSSPTYADAVDFTARYIRVLGPLTEISTARDEQRVTYTCHPVHWPDPAQPIYRFVVEFSLSMHLTAAADIAGDSFRYSRVCLAFPAPAHADAYGERFGCPVLFGQAHNELQYDAAWLRRPATFADPISNAAARVMCDRLLSEVDDRRGLASEIRRALMSQPGRFPSIESMAAQLGMHPRALRRRLEAERTSYRELLAEVRMRLAIEYLRHTRMTNEDIASRLGYSDAANFRHAFTRWTDKSPSEFRLGACAAPAR